MANKSEQDFLDYLKQAEAMETDEDKRTAVGTTNVYPESVDAPERLTTPVHLSNAAQESSKDVREGVVNRILSANPSNNAADRALVNSILSARDFETSSLHLKPIDKVSHVRTPTLLEQTRSLFGRP